MAYLEIKNLSKRYQNAQENIINGLDLNIEKGEFITLIGKSGCGKTTLLRLLCGFESHSEGEIVLNGRVISNNSIWIPPEKRNIGMVFQDYALFPNMTAWENVAFAIKKENNYALRTDEIMKMMDIDDIREKLPHQISGGQQQRVAIARALIRQPDILLLDEPFSNLDLEIREAVRVEIQRVLKEIKATVIFVTHDQYEALSISHRIAILHSGKIQQVAHPYEIYNRPANLFVAEFIGKPNTFTGVLESNNVISLPFGSISPGIKVPFEKGANIKIIAHPEDIILSKNGSIKGIIVEHSFLGAYSRIVISVNISNNESLLIHALLHGIQNIDLGEKINFDINLKSEYHVFKL